MGCWGDLDNDLSGCNALAKIGSEQLDDGIRERRGESVSVAESY